MEYIATFKNNTDLEGYYILIKAKNIEKAIEYIERNYKEKYEKVYPIRVYQRYQDEYNCIGLFNEIKLKEVKII